MSQYSLIKTKRFLPLFITQFFGGFNDNLLRNALVVLISFNFSAAELSISAPILITVASALLILPYIIFSSLAGQIADKFERSKLIRITKYAELAIVALVTYGFFIGNIYFLLFTIFLIGTQSTFFSPMKYSVLPDHLEEKELITGNGMLEGGTFLAILLGSVIGSQLGNYIDFSNNFSLLPVCIIMLAASIIGIFAAHQVPVAPAARPELVIQRNLFASSWDIIADIIKNKVLFYSVMGTSWFWLIGSVFLSQMPTFTKDVLQADANVFTIFLITFSVGIAAGSVACAAFLKGEISAKLAPISLVGVSFFTFLLVAETKVFSSVYRSELLTIIQFFSNPISWLILLSVFGIAFCAGMYIVPLKAIIQTKADPKRRSRVIAADNFINAVGMVAASVIVAILLSIGLGINGVFVMLAVVNLAVAVFILLLLPYKTLMLLAGWLLKKLFRMEVHGMENFHKAGKKVVIMSNHQSALDLILLSALLPEEVSFAENSLITEKWYIKMILFLFKVYRVDPTNPMSTKVLTEQVAKGNKVVFFPEGRMTVTGSLMKIYEVPGVVASHAGAKILPLRIDGAQYTYFSLLGGKVRRRLFPKIRIYIFPPVTLESEEKVGKVRRAEMARKIDQIMADSMFAAARIERTIWRATLDARDVHGGHKVVAEDINRKPMRYKDLILKAIVLGLALKKRLKGEYIALMLPNTLANMVSFYALHYLCKVPVMLNYTAGAVNLNHAIKTTQTQTLITSRVFIARAELGAVLEQLENVEIIYLEDIAKKIGLVTKLKGLLLSKRPYKSIRTALKKSPDSPAVILFTSGSEGAPKGVVLSHKNIVSNVMQARTVIDLSPQDVALNFLPMFHSFGLTVGTFLPIFLGFRTFLYPSPLHYHIIPEMSYATGATILIGTNTFFSRYAQYAHPYDFYSVRYVIAGAEKLQDSTKELWFEKFGIRIFEGYGVTEASPVLSVNTTMHYKSGTVGRLFPGVEFKLKPVEGIDEGGELCVRGPNVMSGYMRLEKPAVLQPPKDGWYETGDIVDVDADHFISIKGRTKRFAKIAGEMVSLQQVEEYVSRIWKANLSAAVSIKTTKKGETIVLVTDYKKAKLDEIRSKLKEAGLANVATPREMLIMEIPVLGTGKIDYPKLQKIVDAKF
jgi:acyl-[acyl-carrier-protein]-phospholipid O-acyltransferase/long-chain-fatty-acid--[acyl-carrier-protein] ligase